MATAINMLEYILVHTVYNNVDSIDQEIEAELVSNFCLGKLDILFKVMPMNQERRLETRDKIFLEKGGKGHLYHPHAFLLQRFRPFKGEPPAVAGYLLYPDSPAKMETTSREAFCFRPALQQDGGKVHQAVHDAHHHHRLFSSEDKRSSSREIKTAEEKQKDEQSETSEPDRPNQDPTELQSQYQKDFPPPTSCRRKRTPAFPQPDNIGINPAFRIDFNTVQRENFPCWPIGNTPQ